MELQKCDAKGDAKEDSESNRPNLEKEDQLDYKQLSYLMPKRLTKSHPIRKYTEKRHHF